MPLRADVGTAFKRCIACGECIGRARRITFGDAETSARVTHRLTVYEPLGRAT
jgi:hypothetical protein